MYVADDTMISLVLLSRWDDVGMKNIAGSFFLVSAVTLFSCARVTADTVVSKIILAHLFLSRWLVLRVLSIMNVNHRSSSARKIKWNSTSHTHTALEHRRPRDNGIEYVAVGISWDISSRSGADDSVQVRADNIS